MQISSPIITIIIRNLLHCDSLHAKAQRECKGKQCRRVLAEESWLVGFGEICSPNPNQQSRVSSLGLHGFGRVGGGGVR